MMRVCIGLKPWWNAEIKETRKRAGKIRRKHREGMIPWEGVKEEEKLLYRTIRRSKKRCWNGWMQEADEKDKWKAVWYTRERDGRNIPTLEGPCGKAVTTEEKEEVLRESGFPIPPASEERVLPNGGDIHESIMKECLHQAIFDQSEDKAPGPDRISLKAMRMVWNWEPRRIIDIAR
jgi:hypothetical protein